MYSRLLFYCHFYHCMFLDMYIVNMVHGGSSNTVNVGVAHFGVQVCEQGYSSEAALGGPR